jgi:hypothetical protein
VSGRHRALHAHPGGLWHISARVMQLLSHALLFVQTLQHAAAASRALVRFPLASEASRHVEASKPWYANLETTLRDQ